MIDTLHLWLPKTIKFPQIVDRAREWGLTVRERVMSGGKTKYLQVLDGGSSIGVQFRPSVSFSAFEKSSTRVVELNPSRYSSFFDFVVSIRRVIDGADLEAADIFRMDLAVDLLTPFNDLKQQASVLFKRHRDSHIKAGTKMTGLYFGKEPEEVVIYDKSAQDPGYAKRFSPEGSTDVPPLTRVEVRYRGSKKLVVTEFRSLPLFAAGVIKKEWSPFKNVRIRESLQMVDPKPLCKRSALIRWGQLEALLNFGGYQNARKQLNKDHNFERNYGPLLERSESFLDLDAYLREWCRTYFTGWTPMVLVGKMRPPPMGGTQT